MLRSGRGGAAGKPFDRLISGPAGQTDNQLVPGFRRLMAEWLAPERLTTVAVTCHLE
jgi:hypothetical protein